MLSYFKINDPYRLILVFLFVLLVRLPVYIDGGILTQPELNWLLVGERTGNGFDLYSETWDDIAPLSAMTYTIMDFLFGRSLLALQILGLLLVFVQSIWFNGLLLNNGAFPQNTYVPAIVYAVLSSLFFDFYTASPVVLSATFIVMSLNNIFSHIQFRAKKDEMILNIGLYLGIATLFYLPSILFMIGTLVVFILFTGTVARRYIMLVFGFVLPILLSGAYFYFRDALPNYLYNFWDSLGSFDATLWLDRMSLLYVAAIPLFFLVLAFFRLMQRTRYNNYQARLLQVMFIYLAVSFLMFLYYQDRAVFGLMILVPACAFYLSHYFQLISRVSGNLMFTLFLAGVVVVNLGVYYGNSWLSDKIRYQTYAVEESGDKDLLEGKKILVLGPDKNPYQYGETATPYLEWDRSKDVFSQLDFYDNQAHLMSSFTSDPPDIIIDQVGIAEQLFSKVPGIGVNYRKEGENIYSRISN